MQIQHFVAKDNDAKVYLIGRFVGALPEVYKKGKWVFTPFVTSIQQDGRLEKISEEEALKLIKERESQQLQVA